MSGESRSTPLWQPAYNRSLKIAEISQIAKFQEQFQYLNYLSKKKKKKIRVHIKKRCPMIRQPVSLVNQKVRYLFSGTRIHDVLKITKDT